MVAILVAFTTNLLVGPDVSWDSRCREHRRNQYQGNKRTFHQDISTQIDSGGGQYNASPSVQNGQKHSKLPQNYV
jgi:hypothetical protein